jgi:hypothetical protein
MVHMNPTTNLFETFHGDKVDVGELMDIIGRHFGGSAQFNETEVCFPGDEHNFAVKVVYNSGGVSGIVPGPALTDEQVKTIRQQVETELLAPAARRVSTSVLFAAVPVRGWFRYRDLFQIRPMPATAPQPQQLLGDHPFLLEFTYNASPSGLINIGRRNTQLRQLELLLVGLLPRVNGGIGTAAQKRWTIKEPKAGEEWKSEYLQDGYFTPELPGEGDVFSTTDDILPMPAMAAADYYVRSGISGGEQLDVPDGFAELLDRFFALPGKEQDRFLRACYWLREAGRTFAGSRSAAFTSLISAVEALMPPEGGPQTKCTACGRPLGMGPTQRFVDFVDRFAPQAPDATRDRREFYRIRSKLSHGGTLLFSDHHVWWNSLIPERSAEWSDSQAAWQLVRAVLVNWLSAQT